MKKGNLTPEWQSIIGLRWYGDVSIPENINDKEESMLANLLCVLASLIIGLIPGIIGMLIGAVGARRRITNHREVT